MTCHGVFPSDFYFLISDLDLKRPIARRFGPDPFLDTLDLILLPVLFPVDAFRGPRQQPAIRLRNQRIAGADILALKNIAIVQDEGEVLLESLLPERGLKGEHP